MENRSIKSREWQNLFLSNVYVKNVFNPEKYNTNITVIIFNLKTFTFEMGMCKGILTHLNLIFNFYWFWFYTLYWDLIHVYIYTKNLSVWAVLIHSHLKVNFVLDGNVSIGLLLVFYFLKEPWDLRAKFNFQSQAELKARRERQFHRISGGWALSLAPTSGSWDYGIFTHTVLNLTIGRMGLGGEDNTSVNNIYLIEWRR